MWDWIAGIFKPATDLIDSLHVSDAERMELRNKLAEIQAGVHAKSVELMKAEASSDHWIVAAVRPICSLVLFGLIIADAYGWAKAPPQVYDLASMYLSIYAGGRSIEKVGKIVKGVIK
jgi:hypothetical protein